jgi:3-methyladenine DNA glycosylase AlkD
MPLLNMPKIKRTKASLPSKPSHRQAAVALRAHANPAKARTSAGFFKESGDDRFLGVSTPVVRKLAKQFYTLPLADVRKLMHSGIHEERSLAHAILRLRFEAAYQKDDAEQKTLFDFYVKNRGAIRGWDGVDDSAPYIVGRHLLERDKRLLYELVRAPRLWDRRIAMVSTWWFIRQGHVADTFKLAEILLRDQEDLIHKATGWMLREAGKKDLAALKEFLHRHKDKMPRTALRYAIEKFSEKDRQAYLQK